jgi:hypothetical protein
MKQYDKVRIADMGEYFFYRLFIGVEFIVTGCTLSAAKALEHWK